MKTRAFRLFHVPLQCLALMVLAGCAPQEGAAKSGKPVGGAVSLANPASVYCLKQGGRLEGRRDRQGNQYSLCHLPGDRVVEEWAFFRQAQGQAQTQAGSRP